MKKFIILIFISLSIYAKSISENDDLIYTFENVNNINLIAETLDIIVDENDTDNLQISIEAPSEILNNLIFSKKEENGNYYFEIIKKIPFLLEENKYFLRVKMPKGIQNISIYTISNNITLNLNMDINTFLISNSGEIKINNLKSNLDISNKSGNTILNNFKGDLFFTSYSGDISLKESGGNFNIESNSGGVNLGDSIGVFKINTESGNIQSSNLDINNNSNFNTNSGDIKLNLKSIDYNISLNSEYGQVSINDNKRASMIQQKSLKNIQIISETESGDIIFKSQNS